MSTAEVFVVRTATVEPFAGALRGAARTRGVDLRIAFSSYEPMVEVRRLATTAGTAILFLTLDKLREAWGGATLCADAAFEFHRELVFALLSRGANHVIVVAPLKPISGWASSADTAAYYLLIGRIASLAEDVRITFVDAPAIASDLGEAQAIDRRFWFHYEAPYSRLFLDRLAEVIASAVARKHGHIKKVLVLDCDNTLWGGVVGEDGVAGIKLSTDDPAGRPFVDFQEQVLALKARGVLLCIASKNNADDVAAVFDAHPHCRLKRSDFAAERVDWKDKADNIRAMATELSLSLDSFVFIDDSEVECARVSSALPMVDVLCAPKKASELPTLLQRYHGFDRGVITDADRRRATDYAAERERRDAREAHADLHAFLTSLQINAHVCEPNPDELPRLAQVTQRTNQFNLTTQRFTEAELANLLGASDAMLYKLSVRDRFGDQGVTGFAVVSMTAERYAIDAFMLSCRVLGRGIEHAFLERVVSLSRTRRGDRVFVGRFVASGKNEQTRRFYADAGFNEVDAAGESRFELALGKDVVVPMHIQTHRSELEKSDAEQSH